jgi:hypothetical protein
VGSCCQRRGEKGGDTDLGYCPGGPWAIFGCGLESVPGALSPFSFSFLFFFSDFVLKILQKAPNGFKPNLNSIK